MSIFKCKMCGGTLNLIEGQTTAECEYCGTVQTVPTADSEKKMQLFTRANRLRFGCEFDKAAGIYESIVAEFPEEAEAYWGLVLCKYGIEYVDDPLTAKKIPTCHRSSFDSVMKDSDFEQACENADPIARRLYSEEAKQIEELRKGIIDISGKEEPYDIFISYKETDANRNRTLDSVIAQEIYSELTAKGYRVFFSRISLEDKLGTEYEPYIFAALHSAKLMLCVGTDYEHFNAVWVKNEWSRFLKLMAADKKKHLIPCFKNIDAYDMPDEIAKFSAQDMGKLGAMQDLLRGVEKLLPKNAEEKPASTVAPVFVTPAAPGVESYLTRMFMYLEDGKWNEADSYAEKVLDIAPKNGSAYLGKLMAQMKVRSRESLRDWDEPFDDEDNYKKAVRFGDDKLKAELQGYINYINERNDRQARELKEKEEAERREAENVYNQLIDVLQNGDKSKTTLDKTAELNEKKEELQTLTEKKHRLETDKASHEKQFSALGMFALSKKRELTAKILQLDSEILRTAGEINRLQDKIDSLSAELEELGTVYDIEQKAVEASREVVLKQQALDEDIDRLEAKLAEEQRNGQSRLSIEEIEREITSKGYILNYIINDKNKLSRLASFSSMPLKLRVKFGFSICFGTYPQSAEGEKSPIEWLVLDEKDGKALVISKYGSDCQPYNTMFTDVTWETCTLRTWLNSTFLNSAFNSKERSKILTTNVTADRNPKCSTNPGNATNDKIFLLSIAEAEKYFTTNESRKCVPTAYAKAQVAYASDNYKTASGEAACWWWLRSPGGYQYNAANVDDDGSVNHGGDDVLLGPDCVRPAFWINLES